jgi:hypothetical protein
MENMGRLRGILARMGAGAVIPAHWPELEGRKEKEPKGNGLALMPRVTITRRTRLTPKLAQLLFFLLRRSASRVAFRAPDHPYLDQLPVRAVDRFLERLAVLSRCPAK